MVKRVLDVETGARENRRNQIELKALKKHNSAEPLIDHYAMISMTYGWIFELQVSPNSNRNGPLGCQFGQDGAPKKVAPKRT